MKVHVVARSIQYAERFQRHNDHLDAKVHLGTRSYLELLAAIIADEAADYALVVHDDTYFPQSSLGHLEALATRLDAEWPNWGVCGNAGIAAYKQGTAAKSVVRYLFDPHAGPNGSEQTVPAQTIDGNTMLLNCRALRKAGIALPDFMGFQFYDIVLCIECIHKGLAVLIAPELSCYHDSKGNQKDFDRAARSEGLLGFFASRLQNRYIETLNGRISIPLVRQRGRIDLVGESLKVAAKGRRRKSVSIIVRSQFRQPDLLLRTLQTAKAFSVAAGDIADFRTVVATDRFHDRPSFVEDWADRVLACGPYDVPDSRALLIRDALASEDSDYAWIVDDDDWLFPNGAEHLSLVLAVCPSSAVVFADSSHFIERFSSSGPLMGFGYGIDKDRNFPAHAWSRSLQGENHIPMCGMIVATGLLRSTPRDVFDRMNYFEDYALQLFAIQNVECAPIVVDTLLAGISVRNQDFSSISNTITESDRSKWNRSLSELSRILTMGSARSWHMFSLSSPPPVPLEALPSDLGRGDRTAIVLFRILRGSVLLMAHPFKSRQNFGAIRAGLKRQGFLGVLKALADIRPPH